MLKTKQFVAKPLLVGVREQLLAGPPVRPLPFEHQADSKY